MSAVTFADLDNDELRAYLDEADDRFGELDDAVVNGERWLLGRGCALG